MKNNIIHYIKLLKKVENKISDFNKNDI